MRVDYTPAQIAARLCLSLPESMVPIRFIGMIIVGVRCDESGFVIKILIALSVNII